MASRSLTPRSNTSLQSQENIMPQKSEKNSESQKNQQFVQKCTAHPDEDLLFVCYNCNMKCLCIECISSTPDCQHLHIGHEIKNIKKAKPDIQILLNQHLMKLKRKIETIGQMNDRINLKKTEIQDINENLQKSIKFQFQEIKNRLQEKENEILLNVDELWGKRLGSLNDLMQKIVQKQKVFKDSQKVIEETMNNLTDQQLCQYYFKKQKDLEELARDTFEGIQVDRALDDLVTFKQEFSTESLKKIIFSFTTLQDEINSLKGLETINTQYMDSENSFFNNSPNFSRIQSIQSQSNIKTIKQRHLSCNNDQILSDIKSVTVSQDLNQTVQSNESQQFPLSFLQKANETVVSKQTNGSNIKNASNFLFTSSFESQVNVSSPFKSQLKQQNPKLIKQQSHKPQQRSLVDTNQSKELQSQCTPTLPYMTKNILQDSPEKDLPLIKLQYTNSQQLGSQQSSLINSQLHSYTQTQQQSALQSPLQPLSRTKSITIYSQNSFINSNQSSMQNSFQQQNQSISKTSKIQSLKNQNLASFMKKSDKNDKKDTGYQKKPKNSFLG